MQGYNARDVARMLDLSVGQVRSYARAGLLSPDRGPRGEYVFSFQDLVLLRAAKSLLAAHIPSHKVRRALERLRLQVPEGRPLSGVQIAADGDRIVAREGDSVWDPDSGQSEFNFSTAEEHQTVTAHGRPEPPEQKPPPESDEHLDPDDWYALGTDLERAAPDHAREAYRRTLELDPHHVDARINLGRLLHETALFAAAEANYRVVLAAHPDNAIALFNLGVTLEDLDRDNEAMELYRQAIGVAPEYADAYYNLAQLVEAAGDTESALGYLKTYRDLTKKS
jgi:tetratricopeptide (TPR) repeat protein